MKRTDLEVWPAPGHLPAARVLHGSVVVRVVWGFTPRHAVTRARNWAKTRADT